MNARVIAKAILVVSLLASITGCNMSVTIEHPTTPSTETLSTGAVVVQSPTGTLVGILPTEEIMPTLTPAPTAFVCNDPLGCVDIAPDKPIHIAHLLSIEGPDTIIGIDALRGVEIAIDDKGGRLLGHRIEFTGENLGCLSKEGYIGATKLVTDDSIVAVIGTSCSSEARSASPVLTKSGFTMVSPSNTGADLTDPSSHTAGYLRTFWNEQSLGYAAAEFAYYALSARKAATIDDDNPFHTRAAHFVTRFKELGGTIVNEEILSGVKDMRSALNAISANNPDVIYYPLLLDESVRITILARSISTLRNVILIGADDPYSPDFLKATGEAAEGMYLTYPDYSFTSQYQDFLKKHQQKYGENPIAVVHAYAYDAALMIFAAIEEVAVVDTDGTAHVGRMALREALFDTSEFLGLSGILTCNKYGDCSGTNIAVYQITSTDPDTWNPYESMSSNPKKVYPVP